MDFVTKRSRGLVNFRALFGELLALLFYAFLDGYLFRDRLLDGVLPHVFADLHRTEVRAAHGAEVGGFGSVLRKGFVVEGAGGDGVEGKIEGVFPTELTA